MNTNRKNILVGVLLITFFLELWAPATSGSTLSGANFKLIIRIAYFSMSLVILLAMLICRKTEIKAYNVFLAITPLVYFFIQKYGYLIVHQPVRRLFCFACSLHCRRMR